MGSKRSNRGSTVLFFRSSMHNRGATDQKLRGIYRFARIQDWSVIVQDAPRSRGEVRALIDAWKPVGCIVNTNESYKCFTSESLRATPTVFIDFDTLRAKEKPSRVIGNSESVGAIAVRHLSSLQLSNFAFVGHSSEWFWSDARKQSFLSHLGKDMRSFSSFTFPSGPTAPATRRKFFNWLKRLPRPCGMLLASDILAEEVYPACAKLKLNIPADIAVLGVDDNVRFCNNLRPTLSSVTLDFRQAGWMAAETLNDLIGDPTLPPRVLRYNPLGITPRGSTSSQTPKINAQASKINDLLARLAVKGANVTAIANQFDCSRRLLELRFREASGSTLLEAIHAVRLKKACQLLCDTNTAVELIATQCGYPSAAAFSRCFRKRLGQTPSNWRRANKRTGA